MQAPMFDGLAFDLLPFDQDSLAAPEVDIGRGEVAEALVIAPMIVMGDEGVNLGFEVAGQIVVFQQYPVLEGLVPALDLALGLGMGTAPEPRDRTVTFSIGQVGQFPTGVDSVAVWRIWRPPMTGGFCLA